MACNPISIVRLTIAARSHPDGSIFAATVLWQYRCNGTGAQQWY
jgi:hypothetical protein